MKNTIKTTLLTAALAIGSLAAHAESFTMTVPFAFTAGGKVLPAGSYAVDASAMMLSLKCLSGSKSESAMLLAIPSDSISKNTSAVFNESTDVAALTSVSVPSGLTYTLPGLKKTALLMTKPLATNPTDGTVLSTRQ